MVHKQRSSIKQKDTSAFYRSFIVPPPSQSVSICMQRSPVTLFQYYLQSIRSTFKNLLTFSSDAQKATSFSSDLLVTSFFRIVFCFNYNVDLVAGRLSLFCNIC